MEPTSTANETAVEQAAPAVGSPESVHRDVSADGDVMVDELLVEEISIDGMCGVY